MSKQLIRNFCLEFCLYLIQTWLQTGFPVHPLFFRTAFWYNKR